MQIVENITWFSQLVGAKKMIYMKNMIYMVYMLI